MPASWIKLRDDLDTDPRVFTMADHLRQTAQAYILVTHPKDLLGDVTATVTRNVMRDIVIAGLSRVWFAANRHTTDGSFTNADLNYLDTLAQVTGFGQAMQLVGYAQHDPIQRTVTLPRFAEYNHPDKNGERHKTLAAKRQAEFRDRHKKNLPPLTSHVGSSGFSPSVSPPPRDAESNAPSNVTNNENTSYSYSPSISESESGTQTPDSGISDPLSPPVSVPSVNSVDQLSASVIQHPASSLESLQRRINTLRPKTWGKMIHWSHEDQSALYAALPNLQALDERDWLLLTWFMHWANTAANTGQKDAVKVTTRRHQFVLEIASYLDRATTSWKQQGCPKLTPRDVGTPARNSASPRQAPAPPPSDQTLAEAKAATAALRATLQPPRPNPAHQLLTDLGITPKSP